VPAFSLPISRVSFPLVARAFAIRSRKSSVSTKYTPSPIRGWTRRPRSNFCSLTSTEARSSILPMGGVADLSACGLRGHDVQMRRPVGKELDAEADESGPPREVKMRATRKSFPSHHRPFAPCEHWCSTLRIRRKADTRNRLGHVHSALRISCCSSGSATLVAATAGVHHRRCL
jgi:hypothetical protein